MILIIPHRVPRIKFYFNPLALRARYAKIFMIARIVTVCYSTTRASEASGLSTGCGKVSASVRVLQNVKTTCIQCDTVLFYKCGGDVYI